MELEPAVRGIAVRFVHITSFALPAFALYRVLYGYSASLNQTKPMMAIALAALVLNCFLNWLLIYGNWGFPQLGGVGCAWATMVCIWFNLGGLLWWMQRAPAYRSTWLLDASGTRSRAACCAWPADWRDTAGSSAFSLHCWWRILAAPRWQHQIAELFLARVRALSLGIALLTRWPGAEPARFRSAVGVGASIGLAVLSALLMALFSPQIAAAYTSDAPVAAAAAGLLLMAALFQVSDAAQVSTSCPIRGYKVTRAPMVIHLTAFWIFALPLGCLLGLAPQWSPWRPAQPLQAQGFWIALVVG
jgi:MATE family multidrug resistance protein